MTVTVTCHLTLNKQNFGRKASLTCRQEQPFSDVDVFKLAADQTSALKNEEKFPKHRNLFPLTHCEQEETQLMTSITPTVKSWQHTGHLCFPSAAEEQSFSMSTQMLTHMPGHSGRKHSIHFREKKAKKNLEGLAEQALQGGVDD